MTLPEAHSAVFAVIVSTRAQGRVEFEGATAFIVEAEGMLFLITAAHVVGKLRDKRDAGQEYICELVTKTGVSLVQLPHLGDPAVTLRLDHQGQDGRFRTSGDDRQKLQWLAALDIAIYPLRPDEGVSLLDGLAVPFRASDMWPYVVGHAAPDEVPDVACVAVGFPREKYQIGPDSALASLALMQAPLEPADAINGADVVFEAAWDSTFFPGSIAGMSGSPVICLAGDQAYLYGVVIAEESNSRRVFASEFLNPYRVLSELALGLANSFPGWVVAAAV